jgi:uncharacterized protein
MNEAANRSWLPGLDQARGLLDQVGGLVDGALDRRLRLAVTGLRRSGKTVLVTALVHHLESGAELPFLEAVHEQRYLGAHLMPNRAGDPPPFPYETLHRALTAAEPDWPEPTDRLTMLRLDLRFRPKGLVSRQLAPIQRLHLEIVDYPGEWLLDLPLLEQDYDGWAGAMVELARRAPRDALSGDWLAATGSATAADDETAARLAESYTAYLHRCQEAGLSLLQPGRFTSPGDLDGSELLAFAPLPSGRPGGLRALMAARFERYKQRIVEPFYRDHFRHFDRQLVLVDVLGALNRGRPTFEDTGRALRAVLRSFRYGRSGWLARFLSPRIDRLVFAATKADHVAGNQHANLKHLLERMVQEAGRAPRLEGVPVEVLAIAAVRSTDTVRTEHQGQMLSCVRGLLKDDRRETVLFPGEIPEDLPEADDWQGGRFRFLDFAPRRLWTYGAREPQHIRLDQVLERLLGDRLQ